MDIIFLTISAFLASIISGMTGVGGGTILIVAMFGYGLAPIIAIPLHAGVQIVSNTTRLLAYFKHAHFASLAWFLVGAIPAPFIVAPYVVDMNPDWVRIILACFVFLSLIPNALGWMRLDGAMGMIVAGILAAGVGMLVGAAGLLLAPFFIRPHWYKQQVIATLALTQAVAHVLKMIAFSVNGISPFSYWHLLLPMCCAVVIGTMIGKRLNGRIAETHYIRVLKVILALLASKLLITGVSNLS